MLQILNLALGVVRFAAAILLLCLAWQWRSPLFASTRSAALVLSVALPLALIAAELLVWRISARWRPATLVYAATALVAFLALALTLTFELQFRWMRQEVLRADPVRLERLGRHLIAGYRDDAALRELIERRAIAGVFVTAHNVRGKDAETIRGEIVAMQAVRARQGLPPLLVATDQEGGGVSRMSPPLARPVTLRDVVQSHRDATERRNAVRSYSAEVGRALAGLGINLNFAPVVDLDHGVVNPNDRYTRIGTRAISSDPELVADTAGEYCRSLGEQGVHCTLKHFPGLGRVFEDTHRESATLSTPVDELVKSDWVPFRQLMQEKAAFTMLAHARIAALDRERPASFSVAVVSGLLRRDWKHDGILVTDDLSMGGAYRSVGGLGAAGVAALGAGVDLILISYDPDQLFPVLHALLRAEASGALPQDVLEASARRLGQIASAPKAAADAR
ncbi:MAG: glycoside hydrolase family 3 protein [Xanthobacteraceae bacterium]|nr:glycoside hydrolase family 3 protein [Xanthobacteraceae bacterium]